MRDHHGTTDIATDRDRHKNHGDRVGGTDSGQRAFTIAGELSGNHAIGNVVQLLENHADEHGQRKQP
jgi:hypothetical protein